MAFAPIAIVGRSCVLPGALDPSALWELVAAGRDLVGPAPEGRWGLDRDQILRDAGGPAPDAAWYGLGASASRSIGACVAAAAGAGAHAGTVGSAT